MADKLDPQATVTGGSLAALLNITARHVADLGDRGVMKRDAAGGYQLHSSVHGYVKFLKESAKDRTKTAFSRRLQDARARSIELKNAQAEHRLIELDEALAVMNEITGSLRGDLDALPIRIGGRDLDLRRRIETVLNEIYQRNADRCAAQADALSKTGEGANQGAPADD